MIWQANSAAEKVITGEEKSLSSHHFQTEISCSRFQSCWMSTESLIFLLYGNFSYKTGNPPTAMSTFLLYTSCFWSQAIISALLCCKWQISLYSSGGHNHAFSLFSAPTLKGFIPKLHPSWASWMSKMQGDAFIQTEQKFTFIIKPIMKKLTGKEVFNWT